MQDFEILSVVNMKMAVIQNVYTVKPSSQLSGYMPLQPFSN